MNQQTAFPLSWPNGWPRTKNPSRSRFGTYHKKPTVAAACDFLWQELRRLGVHRLVLSSNVPLKKDGWPRSDAREPQDTGAAVSFELKGRRCVLACDKWNTVGDNIWAIAHHIEALRAQERWGVGSIEQAFAGYTALPAPTGRDFWSKLGLNESATEADILAAYRELAKTAHPDTGGTHEAFTKLGQAKDMALATILHRARQ